MSSAATRFYGGEIKKKQYDKNKQMVRFVFNLISIKWKNLKALKYINDIINKTLKNWTN